MPPVRLAPRLAALLLAGALLAALFPPAAGAAPGAGSAEVVRRLPTGARVVALTFDAGGDPGYTSQILDTLAAAGVRASFGITGRWAEENPEALRRIVRDGHTVLNHSYSHRSFTGFSTGTAPLSASERADELRRAEAAVQRIAGTTTKPYFRPPYGDYDAGVLADVDEQGYRYAVLWSVDSLGWRGLSAAQITARVLAGLEPGAIYLFHVGSQSQDGPALPGIIAALRARGYGFATIADLLPPVPHDERYFFETGYRIDDEAIWQYFAARGGLDLFGFPVSRTFTFLGCPVQFFQRQIAQVCPGRGVALMNVLDPDIFSYTRVNFSTFPAADDALKAATPKVGEPDYDTRIIAFVRAVVPDVWEGQRVNFQQTFFGLITPEPAGTDDPGLLALLNLEVWGAPISQPARDPNNASFVYQRFQRGIMHYDAVNQVTRGILLADYLKQVLRNSAELPPDLREQAAGSRYFAQYCPGEPGWLCRPDELPGTDLTLAFVPG